MNVWYLFLISIMCGGGGVARPAGGSSGRTSGSSSSLLCLHYTLLSTLLWDWVLFLDYYTLCDISSGEFGKQRKIRYSYNEPPPCIETRMKIFQSKIARSNTRARECSNALPSPLCPLFCDDALSLALPQSWDGLPFTPPRLARTYPDTLLSGCPAPPPMLVLCPTVHTMFRPTVCPEMAAVVSPQAISSLFFSRSSTASKQVAAHGTITENAPTNLGLSNAHGFRPIALAKLELSTILQGTMQASNFRLRKTKMASPTSNACHNCQEVEQCPIRMGRMAGTGSGDPGPGRGSVGVLSNTCRLNVVVFGV